MPKLLKRESFAVALLLVLVLLSSSSLGVVASPSVADEAVADLQVVRAYYDDPQMLTEAATWLEPWEVHPAEGYFVAGVDAAGYARLLALGFRLEVDEALTAQLNTPRVPLPGQTMGIPGYPCYRTVEETFQTALDLANAHPDLAAWLDAGDSWEKTIPGGLDGYDLGVLRLTNVNVLGPKPKLFLMAAIHAREYATAELVTRFAEYLVDNYDVDPDVTWLLDYHEIHLMLQANPDGRKLAEAGDSWRKNTDSDDGCSSSSSWGTDLNRNYSFYWNSGGSSGDPCAETYHGPAAASEPETVAVINYVESEFPDRRDDDLVTPAPDDTLGIFLDIHSYSRLVMWPWGFQSSPPPNGAQLQALGRKFAYFNGYTPQQSMQLYPTSGTTQDWAYGHLGLPGYCFEVGTTFFQACSYFEGTIVPENLGALLYAAKAARTPYVTPSGPDTVDVTATPAEVLPGQPLELTAVANDTRYNNSNGTEPTQNVVAAEYYVGVPPWETGAVAYPMAAVDGAFDEKVEPVEATVDTAGLAPGRHTIFVRSQDANGTWGAVSAAFVTVVDPTSVPVLYGTVLDSATGAPLEATVTAGPFVTATNPVDGFYSMSVLSGTYDVTAEAPGYVAITVYDVPVHDYQVVEQNFDLEPLYLVFADDVESGAGSWAVEGSWAITAEDAHSPAHSWTDSPGGNYGKNWNQALTSPSFDLSGCGDVTVEFWHAHELETNYDFGYLEYSLDGGVTWTQAASFTGNSPGWTNARSSIPALDGQPSARIRFRIRTDGAGVDRDGWHVDDVSLFGSGELCVPAIAPVAAFASTSPVMLGEPMTFTNHTVGTEPIDYLWDLGDGLGTSTERDPVYTYASAGTFVVTLAATNTEGTDMVTGTVEVLACQPVTGVELSLVTTGTLVAGQEVALRAQFYPAGAAIPFTYTLDFGDPALPTLDVSLTETMIVTHTFAAAGTYTVTVAAWNCDMPGAEAVTDTLSLLVAEPAIHYSIYLPVIHRSP
ncbi:MAG: PKD domain-containing protein [Anaerolineae bacterium]|nr:PKD domain-containing protein [Anaerolineae bacterium]